VKVSSYSSKTFTSRFGDKLLLKMMGVLGQGARSGSEGLATRGVVQRSHYTTTSGHAQSAIGRRTPAGQFGALCGGAGWMRNLLKSYNRQPYSHKNWYRKRAR
jgi:hypothetical protein